MVNKDRERLVVVQVCIDTNGKYSIDGPTFEKDGVVRVGTSWVGDGEPDATAIAIGAALRRYRQHFKDSAIKAYGEKAKPKIQLVTP